MKFTCDSYSCLGTDSHSHPQLFQGSPDVFENPASCRHIQCMLLCRILQYMNVPALWVLIYFTPVSGARAKFNKEYCHYFSLSFSLSHANKSDENVAGGAEGLYWS